MTLVVLELVTYFVLLGRLASITKSRRPSVFTTVGGPAATDYLMPGLMPGDSFISKLEARRSEIADEPAILRLMRAVRGAYIVLLVTVCAGFVVTVAYAN